MNKFFSITLFLCAIRAFAGNVSTADELQTAIITANGGGDSTITFTGDITLSNPLGDGSPFLRPLSCTATFDTVSRTITINGGGNTLSGGGSVRGLFARAGTTTINSLTFSSLLNQGGVGGLGGGGGGAGLGGALFVANGATVTLVDCAFSSCSAQGGDGANSFGTAGGGGGVGGAGAEGNSSYGGAGGGGFGGDGGTISSIATGGGGGGGANGAGVDGSGNSTGTAGGSDFGGTGGGSGGAPGTNGQTPGASGQGGGAGGAGSSGVNGGSGGDGTFGGGGGGGGGSNSFVTSSGGAGGAGGAFGGGGGGGKAGVFQGDGGDGGAGGFGGGGGCGSLGTKNGSTAHVSGDGGDGGFGGGGGGNGPVDLATRGTVGSGGFGAGDGGESGSALVHGPGGGGAGLGGAIFIQNGGSVTIQDATFTSNSVVKGNAGTPGTGAGAAVDGEALGAEIFMMAGGSLTLNISSGTVTFSEGIRGDQGAGGGSGGGFTKSGAGTVALGGTNDFTGTSTVSAGTLTVTGTILNTVTTTVSSGATLKGTGTMGPVDVQGTIAPGTSIGTMTVDGDLTLESTSTTEIEINAAGDTSKLIVSGTVTIQSGAILNVTPQSGSYTPGTSWTFIESSGLADNTEFNFTAPGAVPALIVQYNSPLAGYITLFLPGVPSSGLTGNSLSLGGYLNSLASVPSMQGVLTDLATLSGTALDNALISIDPLRTSSTIFSLINTQFTFSDLLFSRWSNQRALRLFPSFFVMSSENFADARFSPERLTARAEKHWEIELADTEEEILLPAKEKKRCEKYNAWVQGFGVFTHETGKNTNPSFDTMSGGFLAAYDWFNWESAIIGGGVGYAHNILDQERNLGKSSSETALATFYATCFKDMFFIDFALWGGYNWIYTNRHVFFSGFDKEAKAKFHSWECAPHLDFGYSFLFSWGAIEPFASLDWAIQFTNRFKERGADPLNMDVRARTSSMLRSEVGCSIYEEIEQDTGLFVARQTLSYVNKKPFSVGQVIASVVGQPGFFTVETFQDVQNLFSPSAEIFFKRKDGVYGSLIYIGEFGSGYTSNEVFLKVGIYF